MSKIQELLHQIQDTDRALADENAISLASTDDIVRINMEAIRKRRADLSRTLATELRIRREDLFEYELARANEEIYPVKAIGRSLVAFQEVITAIFDALRSGPKKRYRPAIENVSASTLDFALAGPGSVSLSLAVPNERLLLIQSDMDRTITLAFGLLKASSSEDVREFVRTVGVAAVSKVYSWAEAHSDYDIHALIKWNKDTGTIHECEVSEDMARNLRNIIAEASDEEETPVTVEGVLLGIDGASSYFHLAVPEAEEINGKLDDNFPKLAGWAINRHYRADLIKTVRLRYATGEETETWTLRNLFEQNKDT